LAGVLGTWKVEMIEMYKKMVVVKTCFEDMVMSRVRGDGELGLKVQASVCGLLETCGEVVLGVNNPQGKKKYR
jgi:hypothetical protein